MFGLLVKCIRTFGVSGFLIYMQLKVRSKKIKLPGIEFPISMRPIAADRVTFKEIFIKREYDIEIPKTITPTVIIDGGANIGFTSLFFANRYPNAQLFSIEPDKDNFSTLKENIAPYRNIRAINSALWYAEEAINIVDKGYGERGFIIDKGGADSILQAISITDILKENYLDHIDILKLDIEGSELEVFSANYESWLPITKCLIIELHDRMKLGCSKAVFKAISQYDFSLSIKGENLVFTNNKYFMISSQSL